MKSILLSLLTLLIFGGGGYYGYITYFVPEPDISAPALQTAQVRRGESCADCGRNRHCSLPARRRKLDFAAAAPSAV